MHGDYSTTKLKTSFLRKEMIKCKSGTILPHVYGKCTTKLQREKDIHVNIQ